MPMNPSPIRPILLILATAASLQAAPLPKSQIAGDAKWVIHLDMEQFAPSQTCRLLMNSKGGSKSLQSIMTHYQTLLGVDPLKDISGLTLYGTEITGNRGTALISGALNHQAITRQFSSYPQYAVRTYGKRQLQTWTDKGTGARYGPASTPPGNSSSPLTSSPCSPPSPYWMDPGPTWPTPKQHHSR